jgi:hypothetical protein
MKTLSKVKITHPLGTMNFELVIDADEALKSFNAIMRKPGGTFSTTSSTSGEIILVSSIILRNSFITITPVTN